MIPIVKVKIETQNNHKFTLNLSWPRFRGSTSVIIINFTTPYGTYIKASFSPPSQREQWQNACLESNLSSPFWFVKCHEFCYGTMNHYIIVLFETFANDHAIWIKLFLKWSYMNIWNSHVVSILKKKFPWEFAWKCVSLHQVQVVPILL